MDVPRPSGVTPGLAHTVRALVEGRLLTSFWEGAPDVDVLATPSLVSLFERAAAEAVDPLLEPGRITVGARISVEHLGAAPAGAEIEADATVAGVEGRLIHFDLSARWRGTVIARGDHTRAVVDRARFVARLRSAS